MKVNRLVFNISFWVIGVFSFVSLQAQEAKHLFINMPDSLNLILTKVNR